MKARTAVVAALLTIATLGLPDRALARGADGTLFRNVNVFDGERTLGTHDVLIEGGVITRVGKALDPGGAATIVDGAGKTLLPGLIDSHVHVFPSAAEDALRFGVTTEFDMFTIATAEMVAARRTQRASLEPTDAADVWSAGNGVTPPGGHPTSIAKSMGVDLRTLSEGGDGEAFIEAQVDEGADYIKIFQEEGSPRKPLPRFSSDRMQELIRLSHKLNRKAVVHVLKMADAREAFGFGADAIAHVWQDEIADDPTIKLIKTRGGAVIATLSVLAGIADDPAPKNLAADPAIASHLSPIQHAMLAARYPRQPEVLARALTSVGRLHDAGVTVLAGTDASNPATAHGASIHGELELLVRAGMTPADALAAATAKPAKFFGTSDRGRIAEGLRADLILVEGDPTTDIKATRRISGIWKNGHPVDRAKMPAMPPMPGTK
jgi:imidazolonepropionase-like amidohydrolase